MLKRNPLSSVVDSHPIVVVCGTGGVGKTTVSAALALGAALRGRKALVMTIDPARRLADALGVQGRLNVATAVDLGAFAGDASVGGGQLDAMMLDAKHTWDEVVERFSPDETTRERILQNSYYQRAAGSLAGSQEYMAMEKLLQLHLSGQYDVIVLDTPPTPNALDFLEAPSRMVAILQDGVLRWLVPKKGRFSSARAGAVLFGKGQQALFHLFERFTGEDVLRGIADFMGAFSSLLEGMRSRASEVLALLQSDEAAFVLVASPRRLALSEAGHFLERLQEGGVTVSGLVVNRVREGGGEGEPGAVPEESGLPLRADDPDWNAMVAAVWATYRAEQRRSQAELEVADELAHHLARGLPLVEVPESEQAIHDLESLGRLLPHLA